MVIRNSPAADLDAAVDPVAEKLELQTELEVGEGPPGREELIFRDGLLERTTDDGAVLDAKRLERSFPAREGLSIEQRCRRRERRLDENDC